ncbi:MAG: energy-coupling factor transporter transmembrane component T [Bacillota bacterium]
MSGAIGYVSQASPVHRLHALVKVLWALGVLITSLAFTDVRYLAGVLASVLVVAAAARVLLRLLPALAGLAVFALILVFFQAVFLDRGRVLFYIIPWAKILPVTGAGLLLGAAMGLRMLSIVLSFLVLLATTQVKDITTMLVARCRVPYDYAFLFATILRFVPVFLREARQVDQAQRARGLVVEGPNPWRKLKGYAPLAVPLVLLSLRRAEQLAVALEMRGYGQGGGVAADRPLKNRDRFLIAGLVLIIGALLAARVAGYGT